MNKLNKLFVLVSFFSSVQMFSQTGSVQLKHISEFVVTPLPEVLLSFDAIINDKRVELTWASNTETNNNYFTIEKSKDAIVFDEVTTLKNFGNNSAIISYFDVDYFPYQGISYYRLKQTDANGKMLSSRIVSVNYRFGNEGLAIYPNTDSEEPTELMGSENKEVLVVLRDQKGQESFSKVVIDENNAVTVSANNAGKLDNGTYVIVASSNNKLYSRVVTVK